MTEDTTIKYFLPRTPSSPSRLMFLLSHIPQYVCGGVSSFTFDCALILLAFLFDDCTAVPARNIHTHSVNYAEPPYVPKVEAAINEHLSLPDRIYRNSPAGQTL